MLNKSAYLLSPLHEPVNNQQPKLWCRGGSNCCSVGQSAHPIHQDSSSYSSQHLGGCVISPNPPGGAKTPLSIFQDGHHLGSSASNGRAESQCFGSKERARARLGIPSIDARVILVLVRQTRMVARSTFAENVAGRHPYIVCFDVRAMSNIEQIPQAFARLQDDNQVIFRPRIRGSRVALLYKREVHRPVHDEVFTQLSNNPSRKLLWTLRVARLLLRVHSIIPDTLCCSMALFTNPFLLVKCRLPNRDIDRSACRNSWSTQELDTADSNSECLDWSAGSIALLV